MEKVDKTIDEICDWIQKELITTTCVENNNLSDMIKALAELLSTRA